MLMLEFIDSMNQKVVLTFDKTKYEHSGHVLILPRYRSKWVLMHHKVRGVEFPGGKIERDELSVNAAARELYEETGAVASVHSFKHIAQYKVIRQPEIIKDVYVVEVDDIESSDLADDSIGYLLVDHIDDVLITDRSPLLEDHCIRYIVRRLDEV